MTDKQFEIINLELSRLSSIERQKFDAIRKHVELMHKLNSDMQKATRQIR